LMSFFIPPPSPPPEGDNTPNNALSRVENINPRQGMV
jgi:hypothetical protein